MAGSRTTAWAALGVACLAVLLMLLPAALALGAVPGGGAVLAVLVASLAAGMGWAKVVAVLGGLAARVLASFEVRIAPAEIE